ncbi:MAG: flagellar export chaperone FliS [Aquificaceae bacterium]|nr:flagellar protein FliS [Aquificaceae bacterium]MCS7195820.1 flagellar protein FliS [Aquificaceae bacterium]MDW8032662.1 flagellar export chaperone FliS [Aquificaceae bacterium]MDW8293756.1 flagellar export chaperone FliS [Aquificaceae bacterium]
MYNSYFENMVLTANPVRQVILLYEKAIFLLKEAIELMESSSAEDHEAIKRKYEAMGKVSDILIVLDTTLNMEEGGEIAKSLHEIYQALLSDLTRITVKGDEPQTLLKMVKILSELKESWEEVEKKVYGRPEAITA